MTFPLHRSARVLLPIFAALVVLLSAPASRADAPKTASAPKIEDRTKTFTASEREELEKEFDAFKDRTGAEVSAVLVESTGDKSLYEFGKEIFERRDYPQRRKAIFLTVVKKPAQAALLVGDDLQSKVGNSVLDFAVMHGAVPRFEKGDWSGGILASMGLLENVIAPRRGTPLVEHEDPHPLADYVVPLLVLTVLFGFGIERILEFALGNVASALLGGVCTFGVGQLFTPLPYAAGAAFLCFIVSYLDILGGHEKIYSASGGHGRPRVSDYYRSYR